MDGRDETGAGLPLYGDQESNPSTSAYQTIVYQSVDGEEHGATACLAPFGRNPETSKHGYVEGLCCR